MVRTTVGALVGGSISKATGGKFANGAISGAIKAAMMGRPPARGSVRFSDGGGNDPGDRAIGRGLMRKANAALAKAGAFRAFATEQEAASAWARTVNPIAGRYEIGSIISYVEGEGFYLGGAFSAGSTNQVNDLLAKGGYVTGGGPNDRITAIIHNHPSGATLSGGDTSFKFDSTDRNWDTPYAYGANAEGDLVTAYTMEMNVYAAAGNNLYYWNYSTYRQAQIDALGSMNPAIVGHSVQKLW